MGRPWALEKQLAGTVRLGAQRTGSWAARAGRSCVPYTLEPSSRLSPGCTDVLKRFAQAQSNILVFSLYKYSRVRRSSMYLALPIVEQNLALSRGSLRGVKLGMGCPTHSLRNCDNEAQKVESGSSRAPSSGVKGFESIAQGGLLCQYGSRSPMEMLGPPRECDEACGSTG